MKDSREIQSHPASMNDDAMLRGIRALRDAGMIAADTPDYPRSVPDTISDELRQQLSNHPSLSAMIEETRGTKA